MDQLFELDIRSNTRGAAGIEYGILIAAIAAVIVGVALLIGPKLGPGFESIINVLP